MAINPIHFQPVKVGDDEVAAVGYKEGANDVGDLVVDAVGTAEGAAVGFDGQLIMPCRNVHKALASSRCC